MLNLGGNEETVNNNNNNNNNNISKEDKEKEISKLNHAYINLDSQIQSKWADFDNQIDSGIGKVNESTNFKLIT